MDPVEALHVDIKEIRADVKQIIAVQSDQGKLQALQGRSLDEHIRRTNLLEDSLELVKADVKPLKDAVLVRAAFTRIGGIVLGLLTAGAAIVEMVYHLKEMGH